MKPETIELTPACTAILADLVAKANHANEEISKFVNAVGAALGVGEGYGFNLDTGRFELIVAAA